MTRCIAGVVSLSALLLVALPALSAESATQGERPDYLIDLRQERERLEREFDARWAERGAPTSGEGAELILQLAADAPVGDEMRAALSRSPDVVARDLAWALARYPGEERYLIASMQRRLRSPAAWRELNRRLYVGTQSPFAKMFHDSATPRGNANLVHDLKQTEFWPFEHLLVFARRGDIETEPSWHGRYFALKVLTRLSELRQAVPASVIDAIDIVVRERDAAGRPGDPARPRAIELAVALLERARTPRSIRVYVHALGHPHFASYAEAGIVQIEVPGKAAILREELARLPTGDRAREILRRAIRADAAVGDER